ncbi:hypothetical protein FRB97_006158 [Tulasnella sp. 331]|nr:hypothetical protein FRB97_006158 [Tulasnella sp. 331]
MPISGQGIQLDLGLQSPTQLHYNSLAHLDLNVPGERHEEVKRYVVDRADKDMARSKLLVCHDYKGGYKDDPFDRSYTFNFWCLCDTIVYFAHHRVTIPPPGWINTAHRNGTKILGTLIFEPDAEYDCLNLLTGPNAGATQTKYAPVGAPEEMPPLSAHYASVLAQLACDRGFDGWLMNFECDLLHKEDQGRMLFLWIQILRQELKKRIGSHSEVVWYDSVTVQGQLAWQCQLNSLNLPWLLSADSVFLDYHWKTTFPEFTARYFDSLAKELHPDKARRDIYFGVDVWGRGCHGGGGFQLHHALDHIQPNSQSLGFSVAVFGPAWTWESKQDEERRTWDKWWDDEVRFWIGPDDPISGDTNPSKSTPHTTSVTTPPSGAPSEPIPPCFHGPYRAISSFGETKAKALLAIPFYTTFSPGVGLSWFVEGERVMGPSSGWTDVDKQTSIGDHRFLWPAPAFVLPNRAWRRDESVSRTAFCFEDAWLGGSSLSIIVPPDVWAETSPEGSSQAIQNVVIPLEQLVFLHHTKYRIRLVYKAAHLDADKSIPSVAALAHVGCVDHDGDLSLTSPAAEQLANGWNGVEVCFQINAGTAKDECFCIIGLRLEGLSSAAEFTRPLKILVGLLSIRIEENLQANPVILGIQWLPATIDKAKPPIGSSLSGKLSWQVALKPRDITPSESVTAITAIDDPRPPWGFSFTSLAPMLSFVYHNIYAIAHNPEDAGSFKPEDATFIATTGIDGRINSVQFDNFPFRTVSAGAGVIRVRLYIRGVKETGQVVPWLRTPYIDIGV